MKTTLMIACLLLAGIAMAQDSVIVTWQLRGQAKQRRIFVLSPRPHVDRGVWPQQEGWLDCGASLHQEAVVFWMNGPMFGAGPAYDYE